MSKIERVHQKIFGANSTLSDCGIFGSRAQNNPAYSKDLKTIQSLSNWDDGLKTSLNQSNKAPFLEDTNSLYYLFTSQIAYAFQEGIVEWCTDTPYYKFSVVKKTQTWELYGSLQDDNLGHDLPNQVSNVWWIYLGDLRNLNRQINFPDIPAPYDPPTNKLYVGLQQPNTFWPIGLLTSRVALSEVIFDVESEWDSVWREAVVKNTGYYQIGAQVCATSAEYALSRIIGAVMKNGSDEILHSYGYREKDQPVGDISNRVTATMSGVVHLTAGDKISLYINAPETYTEIFGKSYNGHYTYLSYARLP
jgi:hypothetical protein